jgi:acetylglutamate synthase
MQKINLVDPFSLEIQKDGEIVEVINGRLEQLTKLERKEMRKVVEELHNSGITVAKAQKKYNRLLEKMEFLKTKDRFDELDPIYAEMDALELVIEKQMGDIQENDTKEVGAKLRIEKSVKSDQYDRIIEICEMVGYFTVLDTINKDIAEKSGNAVKPSETGQPN